MTVSHWFVSAVSGLLLRKGDLWLGTQTQPWDCCSGHEVWQSRLPMWLWMQRMDSAKGSSATASFILQLAELGTWDSAARWEWSISVADQRRERVVGTAEVCVGILCAQQSLKAHLRLLQAPVPMGGRDWGHASREAAEGVSWESWPELTVVLENEAGRGGEKHCFFWTNLGIRCLYLVPWGPWAVFHPWHVRVHVGICCLPGESSRALQHLAGGAAGVQDSRKVQWKGTEPGPAPCFGNLLGREEWASGASKCQALPTHQMCFIWIMCASVCLCVFLAGLLMLVSDLCGLGSSPNIKGSLLKHLFLLSV